MPDNMGTSKTETTNIERPGAKKLSKTFSKNRRIVVIVEEEERFIRIISAMKG